MLHKFKLGKLDLVFTLGGLLKEEVSKVESRKVGGEEGMGLANVSRGNQQNK